MPACGPFGELVFALDDGKGALRRELEHWRLHDDLCGSRRGRRCRSVSTFGRVLLGVVGGVGRSLAWRVTSQLVLPLPATPRSSLASTGSFRDCTTRRRRPARPHHSPRRRPSRYVDVRGDRDVACVGSRSAAVDPVPPVRSRRGVRTGLAVGVRHRQGVVEPGSRLQDDRRRQSAPRSAPLTTG